MFNFWMKRKFCGRWLEEMPGLESRKEKKHRPMVQSGHKDISLDIENALSFLDSEDVEKAPPPQTVPKSVAKSKPSTTEMKADKPLRQKETSTENPLEKEVLHSLEDQEEFVQRRALPPDHSEGKKNTKIWVLLLGVVMLIVLAALVFL
ncbi:conserved hypothetical protein [delta proteobacterium NaphS2]|nr:conserved hypothetical protein [delta proteobacterium NaphS2]